jgi:hypothetical protein
LSCDTEMHLITNSIVLNFTDKSSLQVQARIYSLYSSSRCHVSHPTIFNYDYGYLRNPDKHAVFASALTDQFPPNNRGIRRFPYAFEFFNKNAKIPID